MDCRRIDAILNEHALGTLTKAEEAAVADHLEGCARCAEGWRGQQLVAGDMPAAPRAGFYESVRAQAIGATVNPTRSEPGRWLWPAAGVAAAAVLVLAFAGIFRTGMEVPVPASDPIAASGADSGLVADTPVPQPSGQDFVAGVHYERLSTPVPTTTGPGTIEVCEFFLFTCPHCFSLEPMLVSWQDRQPQDVTLVRVPALWNDVARLQAQAFYTAEALGRLDAIAMPMFEAIHERGNTLASVEEIRALFARQGVEPAEFDDAFTSRRVDASLRRAEELNRLYGIDSTPTLTVNGKYATGPGMAGSYEAVFDIVDALVESERAALAQSRASSAQQATTIDELIDLIRGSGR